MQLKRGPSSPHESFGW